jgi:hypothetical protein
VAAGAPSHFNCGLISIPSQLYLLGIVVPSSKLVEVSLKVPVLDEDELASAELLDEVVSVLEELELDDEELGVMLDDELDVLVAPVELLPSDELPPQAASNKNDK